MAKGDELLIVDSSDRDREGLRKFFDDEGYVCTAVSTGVATLELLERKFFPAAIVDLDVDAPDAGLDLARAIRERSEPTAIVLLTSRRTFEPVVAALRLGVVDVIHKRPDAVGQLKRAAATATDRYRTRDKTSDLVRDVRAVLDDAFRVMVALARRAYVDTSGASGPLQKPRVLVADDDAAFARDLVSKLPAKEWHVVLEPTGGTALDRASSETFDVVAARAELLDLPGAMVVKSLQQSRAELLALVYSSARQRIERIENGKSTDQAPLRNAADVAEQITLLVQALSSMRRDRRFLQAFRAEHEGFLKRFSELKSRIDGL